VVSASWMGRRRVVTPDGEAMTDLRIEDGRIAELGRLERRTGETVLDVAGCVVMPGAIDLHVHLDDEVGGVPIADDFAAGTEAAVREGVTTIASFITQRAGESLAAAVRRMVAKASGRLHADLALHLTPTGESWDWDEIGELVEDGYRTFKLYTTYREAGLWTPWDRLEAAMRRFAGLGATVLVHCEDQEVLDGVDPAALDLAHPSSQTRLRPERAEVVAISRLLDLTERTRCSTHVVHVSTAYGAARIAASRATLPVTSETAPHYLLLDERALSGYGGHRRLCTPPLRQPVVRAALEATVAEGAVDLLASDHCPFRRADKDVLAGDLRAVPSGLPGVGALLPLAWELLVERHGWSLPRFAELMAAAPARVLGLAGRKGAIRPGADADLSVVDPAGPARPVRPTLADAYPPLPSATTRLVFRHVLLGGAEVVRDGVLTDRDHPCGRLLAKG